MASVRILQRRLLSLITHDNRLQTSSFQGTSPSFQYGRSFFSGQYVSRWGLQTQAEPLDKADEDVNDHNDSRNQISDTSAATAVAPPSHSINDKSQVKFSALSNLKASSRHDLAMVFTCRVCETRSVKMACRESYEKGVVVVRCSGCNNLHLIADRLGWFGEPGSVEDFLAARGEEVKKGSTDTLNLTLEDLAGTKA